MKGPTIIFHFYWELITIWALLVQRNLQIQKIILWKRWKYFLLLRDVASRSNAEIDNLITHISFYLFIFYLLPKKTQTDYTKILKADRKRKKAISEAKKATKEAINIGLKRKHEEAKQSGPYLIKLNKLFISLYYIIDKFKAKSEHSISNVATVFHL